MFICYILNKNLKNSSIQKRHMTEDIRRILLLRRFFFQFQFQYAEMEDWSNFSLRLLLVLVLCVIFIIMVLTSGVALWNIIQSIPTWCSKWMLQTSVVFLADQIHAKQNTCIFINVIVTVVGFIHVPRIITIISQLWLVFPLTTKDVMNTFLSNLHHSW